jgi:antitoxin YefM
MTMFMEYGFTEARKDFTSVIDRVQHLLPVVIQPRKKSEEPTFLFKQTVVHQLLSEYKFQCTLVDEEEGSYAYWLDPLDIYGYGETKEDAINSLIDDLLLYCEEYTQNPERYLSAPNRKHHLPYVFKVMCCNDPKEIKQMLIPDAS